MKVLRMGERLAMWVLIIVCLTFASMTYFGHIHSGLSTADASLAKEMKFVNTVNIGKDIPKGIVVEDSEGRRVDLGNTLHGRTLVIKVAMDCKPCIRTLKWIRVNGGKYVKTQNATIDIVVIRSAEEPSWKSPQPTSIKIFHVPGSLDSSFLSGSFTPSEYFFANRKLVTRRTGYVPDMDRQLIFPGS